MTETIMTILTALDLDTPAKWEVWRQIALCLALVHAHLVFFFHFLEAKNCNLNALKKIPIASTLLLPQNREEARALLFGHLGIVVFIPCSIIAFLKS